MKQPAFTYRFPNQMGRLILCSMEEVIGKNGLSAVLNLAGFASLIDDFPSADEEKSLTFEMLGSLQGALEQAYGPRGGRGLALRSGRVFFTHIIREYGPEMGLADTAFRLQPLKQKVRTALDALAAFFTRTTDQSVVVTDTEEQLLWRVEHCPLCWERHEREPVCHFTVGMLQEGLYWVSGGKIYNIVEEGCIASGDPACVIVIDRIPLA
ncbi:MAG: 4-vinyl reductase [Chloroflexota bacterium]